MWLISQSPLALDEPLLFHTGPRKIFPPVREAVTGVLPVERVRCLAFSHLEADGCGSLNAWLAAAPQSVPVCGSVAAMVSISHLCRPGTPRACQHALTVSDALPADRKPGVCFSLPPPKALGEAGNLRESHE